MHAHILHFLDHERAHDLFISVQVIGKPELSDIMKQGGCLQVINHLAGQTQLLRNLARKKTHVDAVLQFFG